MKRILILLPFLLSVILIFGQEAIPASGGEASSNEGSVSYTVGQIFYSTYSGSEGSVAEGVQQPYEISIVTGFDQAKELNLTYSAFPNPTKDKLILNIENYDSQHLWYQLYDQTGNLLEKEQVTANRSFISVRNHSPGTYFLKVVKNQEELIIFKIIKH